MSRLPHLIDCCGYLYKVVAACDGFLTVIPEPVELYEYATFIPIDSKYEVLEWGIDVDELRAWWTLIGKRLLGKEV